MFQKFIPKKKFIYKPLKTWTFWFLQRLGMVGKVHQNQQIYRGEERIMTYVWDGIIWRKFTGTRAPNDPPVMSLEGSLGFSIYFDWLDSHGKSRRLAIIGTILLACLSIPSNERLNPENVYISVIIPGSKEPTSSQMNYLLMA
ncbi:hypothetical protein O181_076768 [Austropuccinia psidii MF-1]|uniref:Uncharacterized protein n=1 Tax=Austropuccinia psidii MF-1 TaxID=1389203 RepID=A0A9Q3ID37_9BASI|nr:hypothetical protein [Austropuccinia psidii MF-1]